MAITMTRAEAKAIELHLFWHRNRRERTQKELLQDLRSTYRLNIKEIKNLMATGGDYCREVAEHLSNVNREIFETTCILEEQWGLLN